MLNTRNLSLLSRSRFAHEQQIPLIPQFRGTPMAREQFNANMFSAVHQEIQKEKAERVGSADPGETCNSQFRVYLIPSRNQQK